MRIKRAICICFIIIIAFSFSCCSVGKESTRNEEQVMENELISGFNGTNWGFISSKTGDFVIEPQFIDADKFSDCGLAPVQIGEKWGYINEEGDFIIEPQYDAAGVFSKAGIAAVFLNGKWGCINTKGTIIVEPKFHELGRFGDYYVEYPDNDLSYINSDLSYVRIYDDDDKPIYSAYVRDGTAIGKPV